MWRSSLGSVLILLAAGGLAASCSSVHHSSSYPNEPGTGPAKSRGHGPPPHAPAHGYRAKSHDGVELVFRSNLGVYAVVEASDHYYLDGTFYRYREDGWSMALRFSGPWGPVSESGLPPGLRAKKSKKAKGKAKGHDR